MPCRRRVPSAVDPNPQAADVELPAQQPPLTRRPQPGYGRDAPQPRRLECHPGADAPDANRQSSEGVGKMEAPSDRERAHQTLMNGWSE
ncbi:hypothetical protein V499_08928 [Pseudogymnoascus sp. VKM F-103]|nr:hypothetical protein V499_08928 [Pseudogymnoascus sp. VKM F-103]